MTARYGKREKKRSRISRGTDTEIVLRQAYTSERTCTKSVRLRAARSISRICTRHVERGDKQVRALVLRGKRETSRTGSLGKQTSRVHRVRHLTYLLRASGEQKLEESERVVIASSCERAVRSFFGKDRSCEEKEEGSESEKSRRKKERRGGRASRKESRRWPTVTGCGRICEECVLEGPREKRSSKRGSIALTGPRSLSPCLFPPRRRRRRRHCHCPHHRRHY